MATTRKLAVSVAFDRSEVQHQCVAQIHLVSSRVEAVERPIFFRFARRRRSIADLQTEPVPKCFPRFILCCGKEKFVPPRPHLWRRPLPRSLGFHEIGATENRGESQNDGRFCSRLQQVPKHRGISTNRPTLPFTEEKR